MKIPNQRSNIDWNPYLAIAYAEGFGEGEDATLEEAIEAWSYITHNKLYLSLQGWFGRTVGNLIDQGVLSSNGDINWEEFDSQIKN